MGQLDGKTAIVTDTGIGKGIALGFARESANLVVASRNKLTLNATAEELAKAAVATAAMPPYVNMLESIVLPVDQLCLGRG